MVLATMLMVNILCQIKNKENITKNIGDIVVDAQYVPIPQYIILELYVVGYTIFIG
jgi:uncharacterized membrane protein